MNASVLFRSCKRKDKLFKQTDLHWMNCECPDIAQDNAKPKSNVRVHVAADDRINRSLSMGHGNRPEL